MQTQIYSFHQQSLIGKKGELIIDEWIQATYKITDVSDIPQYQTSGIDRLLTTPDNSVISAEYKFDVMARRTGNLFFETISVDRRNIPGWGWSSQADYWFFLIPEQEILVIKPAAFRALVWQNREKINEKHIPNRGYKTIGYPIKLTAVRGIAHQVRKLDDPLVFQCSLI